MLLRLVGPPGRRAKSLPWGAFSWGAPEKYTPHLSDALGSGRFGVGANL